MPFKMMFLPGVILLSISAAVSFKVPPGDSVGQEKMVLDSEHSEKPRGLQLGRHHPRKQQDAWHGCME